MRNKFPAYRWYVCSTFLTIISVMDFLYSCNYPKLVNKLVSGFLFCFVKQKKWFLIFFFFFSFNIFHLSKIFTETGQCDHILSVYQTLWTIPSEKETEFPWLLITLFVRNLRNRMKSAKMKFQSCLFFRLCSCLSG